MSSAGWPSGIEGLGRDDSGTFPGRQGQPSMIVANDGLSAYPGEAVWSVELFDVRLELQAHRLPVENRLFGQPTCDSVPLMGIFQC